MSAREKIVEGAGHGEARPSTILRKDQVCTLSAEARAAMVSNLMVVLCSTMPPPRWSTPPPDAGPPISSTIIIPSIMTTAIIGIGSMGGAPCPRISCFRHGTLDSHTLQPHTIQARTIQGERRSAHHRLPRSRLAADIILLELANDDIEGTVEEIASIDLTGKIIVSLEPVQAPTPSTR